MRKIPYLHIALFLLTCLSTLTVGALHENADILREPLQIYKGFPFAATLMTILLAHEFSHYFFSRRHNVNATLPYFIPAPTLFGTLGAFIKMRSPITSKNALMDIGASGPIAGFIVSIIAASIGLFFSPLMPMKTASGMISLGDSLLFKALTRLIVGNVPDTYDVMLHPVAFAGWIGFFVTSLNLIPVGQLDGGHISYALLGEKHSRISLLLIGIMVVLGISLWEGWIVWAVLLLFLGFKHPPIVYSWEPLDPARKITGWAALVIFILTFTPVPITTY